jgi:predicted DNA-binding transcriptional regulator AlpA
MEERWLSIDVISKHLGICNDTVYQWIACATCLPIVWGVYKFKKSEIDDWVRTEGTVEPSLSDKNSKESTK